MKRTFNYTGRKKIEQEHVQLILNEGQEGLSFDAVLQLDSYKFPSAASVFVEAYRQSQWMQFDFGTIATRRQPDRRLSIFDGAEGLLFRVRVVMQQGSEKNKLVGEADRIPLVKAGQKDDRRRPIIEPEGAQLDQLLWQLVIDHDGPHLLVNSSTLPTWRDFARNPLFIALVYPEVMRQVLLAVLIKGKFSDEDGGDESSDWQRDWINFARGLGAGQLPPINELEMRQEWVEDAVRSFAARHSMKSKADLAVDAGENK